MPLAVHSAASIRRDRDRDRGRCGGLQGSPCHFQGSFLGLVAANKSSGVDENATLNPAELWQGFISDPAPLLEQGQPGRGRQKDKLAHNRTLLLLLTSCLHEPCPDNDKFSKGGTNSERIIRVISSMCIWNKNKDRGPLFVHIFPHRCSPIFLLRNKHGHTAANKYEMLSSN